MDQFNSHSKSTVFSPSIFLVHFILFRIHEIGKEKKMIGNVFLRGVFHYLFLSFFVLHVHVPASLVERETSRYEADSTCTPNKVTSIFSRGKTRR